MNFNKQFAEILTLAQQARYNAFKNVNAELLNLYWQVGEYISRKVESAEWGMNVVDNLADFMEKKSPDLKGFERRGLYRMKQFFETYKSTQIAGITGNTRAITKVSALRTQLKKNNKNTKVSALRTQFSINDVSDIKSSILAQLSWTNHRLILSKTTSDEEKITDFEPEHLGKMNFYLEALDRDVKKKHENPSVGVLLCKQKDNEVVEYALSRNLSPTMISKYKTQLIDKKLLKKKLHELFLLEDSKSFKN